MSRTLSDRGITIGRVMMIIALAAANLALLREVPWETHKYPTIWVFLGIVDYVVLRKLILRRTLRAADYAFLIVLVVAFIPLVYLTAEERIHPVGPLIRAYQLVAGDAGAGVVHLGIAFVCDNWMAAAMAILIAWAAALAAAWLERRRGHDIAAVARGTLAGYGIAILIALVARAFLGSSMDDTAGHSAILLMFAACVILGGWLGVTRLRSKGLEGPLEPSVDPGPGSS